MGSSKRETTQRLLAVALIVTMLLLMGIPIAVILFFAVVVFFVWRAVQRSEQQETGRIFEFYTAANEILREQDKRWYGFEIAEVIGRGEVILKGMKDAPPLIYFALGALYHRSGEDDAAVEHLSYLLENESGEEASRTQPSPELRRYVRVLRKLERAPAEAPRTMASIRSLSRARNSRATALLAESRERLTLRASQSGNNHDLESKGISSITLPLAESMEHDSGRNRQSLLTPVPPPPISELLHNLYEEEKKTA